jgi:hypothetical protein
LPDCFRRTKKERAFSLNKEQKPARIGSGKAVNSFFISKNGMKEINEMKSAINSINGIEEMKEGLKKGLKEGQRMKGFGMNGINTINTMKRINNGGVVGNGTNVLSNGKKSGEEINGLYAINGVNGMNGMKGLNGINRMNGMNGVGTKGMANNLNMNGLMQMKNTNEDQQKENKKVKRYIEIRNTNPASYAADHSKKANTPSQNTHKNITKLQVFSPPVFTKKKNKPPQTVITLLYLFFFIVFRKKRKMNGICC